MMEVGQSEERFVVYLNRIYTRGGDCGETSLGDGTRVLKTHPRVLAYGGVDELNAALGSALAAANVTADVAALLQSIQNDLFDVGADLCVPESYAPDAPPALRVTEGQVTRLEQAIDGFNERLQPLTSFILPGGSLAAAAMHHTRTVCRRAEIGVVALAQVERVNPQVVCYLNRLSDLLFVLARICNNDGRDDVLWTPGQNR
jgi:cob(I)alamin adenosyltransferase